MTDLVKVPKSFINSIKSLAHKYGAFEGRSSGIGTIDMRIRSDDPSVIYLEMSGFGLINQMDDCMKNTFSRYFMQDFIDVGKHDSIKKIDVEESSACVIINANTMTSPSITFAFYVQKVATVRQ